MLRAAVLVEPQFITLPAAIAHPYTGTVITLTVAVIV
jgi:hypothetical protein